MRSQQIESPVGSGLYIERKARTHAASPIPVLYWIRIYLFIDLRFYISSKQFCKSSLSVDIFLDTILPYLNLVSSKKFVYFPLNYWWFEYWMIMASSNVLFTCIWGQDNKSNFPKMHQYCKEWILHLFGGWIVFWMM